MADERLMEVMVVLAETFQIDFYFDYEGVRDLHSVDICRRSNK